jgi:hypothetical protein
VKVKLDENLGAMGAGLLKSAGNDVATVADQNLLTTPDADLARICAAEGRCLVTLDTRSAASDGRNGCGDARLRRSGQSPI